MISSRSRAGAFFGAVLGVGMAWGWFEAGWVRLRQLQVPLPGLAPELDGVRIAHLSDFHLGIPSRGRHAVERAVEWVVERRPHLVCITGDLVSRPSGEPLLRELVGRLGDRTFAVLGNHDVEHSRDPFSRSAGLSELEPARLLVDEAATVEVAGARVQIVGVDPRAYRQHRAQPSRLVDRSADLRILLCHYPYVVDRLAPGDFQLVLAGHLHDGQITIPYGFGKVRLAHLSWRYTEGLYRRPAATMHISSGLGTTFVPFRFCARPEATELLLEKG